MAATSAQAGQASASSFAPIVAAAESAVGAFTTVVAANQSVAGSFVTTASAASVAAAGFSELVSPATVVAGVLPTIELEGRKLFNSLMAVATGAKAVALGINDIITARESLGGGGAMPSTAKELREARSKLQPTGLPKLLGGPGTTQGLQQIATAANNAGQALQTVAAAAGGAGGAIPPVGRAAAAAAAGGLAPMAGAGQAAARGLNATATAATFSLKRILALTGGLSLLFKATRDAIGFQNEFTKAIAFEENVTRPQIKALEELTRALSIELGISASEAAKGLKALAQAGLSVETQMKSLRTVLGFAVISEQDMNQTVRQLVDTFSAFALKTGDAAKDAAQFQRVADVIALGAQKTSVEVSEMATSVARVGGRARLMGLSLEQATAILLDFSQKGFKGAAAAGAFEQSMRELTERSKEIRSIFGVNVFDPNGQLRTIPDIIDDIQKSLVGLTPEQVAKKFDELRARSSKYLQILLGGQKDVALFVEQLLKASGAAARILGAFMQSLERQLGRTMALFSDMAIQILPDVIRGFNDVAEPITRVLHGLVAVDQVMGRFISRMAGAAASLLALGVIVTDVLPFLITRSIAGFAAFGRLIGIITGVEPVLTIAGFAMRKFGGFLKALVKVLRNAGHQFLKVFRIIPFFGHALEGFFGGFLELASHLGIGLAEIFEDLGKTLQKNASFIGKIFGGLISGGIVGAFAVIKATVQELKKIPAVAQAMERLGKTLQFAWERAKMGLQAFATVAERFLGRVLDSILDKLGVKIDGTIIEGMEGATSSTRKMAAIAIPTFQKLEELAKEIGERVKFVGEHFEDYVVLLKKMFSELGSSISENILIGLNKAKTEIREFLLNVFEDGIYLGFRAAWNLIKEELKAGFPALGGGPITPLGRKQEEDIEKWWDKFEDEGRKRRPNIFPESIESFKKMLEKQKDIKPPPAAINRMSMLLGHGIGLMMTSAISNVKPADVLPEILPEPRVIEQITDGFRKMREEFGSLPEVIGKPRIDERLTNFSKGISEIDEALGFAEKGLGTFTKAQEKIRELLKIATPEEQRLLKGRFHSIAALEQEAIATESRAKWQQRLDAEYERGKILRDQFLKQQEEMNRQRMAMAEVIEPRIQERTFSEELKPPAFSRIGFVELADKVQEAISKSGGAGVGGTDTGAAAKETAANTAITANLLMMTNENLAALVRQQPGLLASGSGVMRG